MSARVIPDFIVIGAMKAASTSLYGYLSEHPDVAMSPTKELDFFVTEKTWPLGWDWYRRQFPDAPEHALRGDVSPNYTKHPLFVGVPERIREHAPDAKLIYLLRDPIARIRSHYTHGRLSGRERHPAEDAIVEGSTYVTVSRYGHQLAQYLEVFPREQVLVELTEDLSAEPQKVLVRIEDFLGLERHDYRDLNRRDFDSTERRATSALGHRLRRNEKLIWWLRGHVPAPLRARATRLLSREAGAGKIDIPDVVFDRLRDVLAADWALLHDHTGIRLDRWPQLERLLAGTNVS